MKWKLLPIICTAFLSIVSGCVSVPKQSIKDVKPEDLIGTWQSDSFAGLKANDYSSESLKFNPDSTFYEKTEFKRGVTTELKGTYKIKEREIF